MLIILEMNYFPILIVDYLFDSLIHRQKGNPPGNRSPNPAVAPHNTYRCKGDDRWCVISIFDDQQWAAFVDALGKPDWATATRFATNESRVQHQDDLDMLIETWTTERTPHEAMHTLQAAGIAAGAVQTPKEKVDEDPQLRHRDFIREAAHAEMGNTRFEGQPMNLSKSPWELRRPSPLLGEHADYVYHQLLGTPDEEIARMAEEAVF